jgi:hypothetical protein
VAAWIVGIVLFVALGIPFVQLRFGECEWLQGASPYVCEHRRIVSLVYVGLCFALWHWLSSYFSARYRRMNGAGQTKGPEADAGWRR